MASASARCARGPPGLGLGPAGPPGRRAAVRPTRALLPRPASRAAPAAAAGGGLAAAPAAARGASAAAAAAAALLAGARGWRAAPRPRRRERGAGLSSVAAAAVAPGIRLPDPSGPFRGFETFGWAPRPDWSLDDNLLCLAYTARLNTFKLEGYHCGHCCAVLCRPPRAAPGGARPGGPAAEEVEVIGFGINAPPRFAPATVTVSPLPAAGAVEHFAGPSAEVSEASALGGGAALGERDRRRGREIHAEVQVLARCARLGVPTDGCWLYVTLPPCWECSKALVVAGIRRVVFQEYKRPASSCELRGRLFADAAGVAWEPRRQTRALEEHADELWARYKAARGLDRLGVKALASSRPL